MCARCQAWPCRPWGPGGPCVFRRLFRAQRPRAREPEPTLLCLGRPSPPAPGWRAASRRFCETVSHLCTPLSGTSKQLPSWRPGAGVPAGPWEGAGRGAGWLPRQRRAPGRRREGQLTLCSPGRALRLRRERRRAKALRCRTASSRLRPTPGFGGRPRDANPGVTGGSATAGTPALTRQSPSRARVHTCVCVCAYVCERVQDLCTAVDEAKHSTGPPAFFMGPLSPPTRPLTDTPRGTLPSGRGPLLWTPLIPRPQGRGGRAVATQWGLHTASHGVTQRAGRAGGGLRAPGCKAPGSWGRGHSLPPAEIPVSRVWGGGTVTWSRSLPQRFGGTSLRCSPCETTGGGFSPGFKFTGN